MVNKITGCLLIGNEAQKGEIYTKVQNVSLRSLNSCTFVTVHLLFTAQYLELM